MPAGFVNLEERNLAFREERRQTRGGNFDHRQRDCVAQLGADLGKIVPLIRSGHRHRTDQHIGRMQPLDHTTGSDAVVVHARAAPMDEQHVAAPGFQMSAANFNAGAAAWIEQTFFREPLHGTPRDDLADTQAVSHLGEIRQSGAWLVMP